MKRFFSSVVSAIKWSLVALVIFGALAFFGAPTFFGVAMITSGAIATVLVWTAIGWVFGFVVNFFITKKEPETKNRRASDREVPGPEAAEAVSLFSKFLGDYFGNHKTNDTVDEPPKPKGKGKDTDGTEQPA